MCVHAVEMGVLVQLEVDIEMMLELEVVVVVVIEMAMVRSSRNICLCEFYQDRECRRRVGLGPGWNGAE